MTDRGCSGGARRIKGDETPAALEARTPSILFLGRAFANRLPLPCSGDGAGGLNQSTPSPPAGYLLSPEGTATSRSQTQRDSQLERALKGSVAWGRGERRRRPRVDAFDPPPQEEGRKRGNRSSASREHMLAGNAPSQKQSHHQPLELLLGFGPSFPSDITFLHANSPTKSIPHPPTHTRSAD